jgi:pyruvate formate lyase activating enzyme
MSAEAIMAEFRKNKAFYRKGGITVTGGEPLMQIDFLLELFALAKKENVHTCLDTSGALYRSGESAYNQKLDRLMEMTDLVMLDIKHTDPEGHRRLTGQDNAGILAFARYLDQKGIPVWIRHVVVPGITDGEAHLMKLGELIGELSNVKALDILPYHTMGVSKYKELDLKYPLEGLQPMPKQGAAEAKKTILAAYREKRLRDR